MAVAVHTRNAHLAANHELLGQHISRLEADVAAHGRREAAPIESHLHMAMTTGMTTEESVSSFLAVQAVSPAGGLGKKRQIRCADEAQASSGPTSLTEAAATPPTIGSSDSSTAADARSPRNTADSSTEKKGSMACMPAPHMVQMRGFGLCLTFLSDSGLHGCWQPAYRMQHLIVPHAKARWSNDVISLSNDG